jgi:hypothetical protein
MPGNRAYRDFLGKAASPIFNGGGNAVPHPAKREAVAVHSVHTGVKPDVFFSRKVRVKARLLEDDADVFSDVPRFPVKVVSGDDNAACAFGEGRC